MTQKLAKILPNKSSVVISPLISPKWLTPIQNVLCQCLK